MIFIVYFIGTIGLIYCRLIFKLANRKRGHTICTQIMCASKYPSALIHPQTIHARKYTNRHIVFCITHTHCATFTTISPKNTNSSAAYRASNRRCRYTYVFAVFTCCYARKYVFFFCK